MPGLSLVNAGVGLLLPMLLTPQQFGRYAIIVTLFQYGLIFDLGMSQLTDRRVPLLLSASRAAERRVLVDSILWIRLLIAATVLLGGAAIIGLLSTMGDLFLPPIATLLSLTAGIFFMVTLGPASVYRAASNRRMFGNINIALMLVLAIARPAGLLGGGVTGCFVALAGGYAALAFYVQRGMRPSLQNRPTIRGALALVGAGLPLFLSSFSWAFYMTANRWVVSTLADATEMGQFAFGSNVVTLIVGAVGSLGQFYYPRIVAQCGEGDRSLVSPRLGRDICALAAGVTVMTTAGILIGPPLIAVFYPHFVASIPAVLLLLLATPALTVASWLMPIALSTTGRPWVEALVVYPGALLILLVATWLGYGAAGVSGAALGLAVSAAPLLGLQLLTLRSAGLLAWRECAMIFTVSATATILLLGVVLGRDYFF